MEGVSSGRRQRGDINYSRADDGNGLTGTTTYKAKTDSQTKIWALNLLERNLSLRCGDISTNLKISPLPVFTASLFNF